MAKVLKSYGIPDMIVNAIINIYANTLYRATLCTPDGISEEFDILAGVLQRDTLAPHLFTVILDYNAYMHFESNQWTGRRIGFYHFSTQKPKVIPNSNNSFRFCGRHYFNIKYCNTSILM